MKAGVDLTAAFGGQAPGFAGRSDRRRLSHPSSGLYELHVFMVRQERSSDLVISGDQP